MTTTPIGQAAASARERLSSCEHVEGQGADPVGFVGALACAPRPATSTTATPTATWALPAIGGQRFVGSGVVDGDGALRLTGSLVDAGTGAAGVALDSSPPTTSILRPAQRAAWAHLRIDGFDPAGLMPASGGQADDLFAVNSALALRGLTTGEIELGLYPPQAERSFPVSIVAIGIRTRTGAQAALASLVERLEQRWSTKAHTTILAGRPGTCLPEVNILPEFAPCAVVTDDDLIIGWNAHAIEVGLAEPGDGVAVSTHQIAFDFTKFIEADRQLEAALAAGRPVLKQLYPWSTLRFTVGAGSDQATAAIVLEGPAL